MCNYFSLNTEKLADIQLELADTQSKLEELKKKYEALEHEVENLRKAKGKEID